MTTTLRIAAAGLLLLFAPFRLEAQSPMREVLDSEALQALGIHRFSDLVAWVEWGGSTQDGISWIVSLDGLPQMLQPSSPRWYVDGVPTDISSFGVDFPELLPAIVQEVDSVVVRRGSPVIGGRRAGRGAVEIFTREAPSGPAAQAWVRHGAETGDPGPFVYTPYRTRGVDQTGPDGSLIASWRSERWQIDGGARYLRTDVSDANLRERYGEDYLAFTQARGGQIGASVDALGGTHRLSWARYNQIGHSSVDGQDDFARIDLTRASLNANGGFAAGTGRLRYRASQRHVDGTVVERAQDADHTELDAGIELHLPLTDGALMLAASTRQRDGAEAGAGDESTLLAQILEQPVAGWSIGADVAALHLEENWVFEGGISAERPIGEIALVELFAGRSHQAGSGDLFADVGGASAARSTTDQVGGGIALFADGPLRLSATVFATRADMELRSDLIDGWVPFDRRTRRGAEAALAWSPTRHWTSTVRYTGLAGNHGASAATSPLLPPEHRLRALSILRVAPTFHISASGHFTTSRELRPDPRTAGLPQSSLGSLRRIDLGVDKTFWSDRLQATFWLRNLLGQPEQLHPHGADFGFRYFISARFRIP